MKYTFDTDAVAQVTLGQVATAASRTPVYAVKGIAHTLSFSVRTVGWLAGQLATTADAVSKSLDHK